MFIENVINVLDSHQVNYVLVGGYAVALHGAVRGTVDVDIVISLDIGAYRDAEKALQTISMESKLPFTS